MERDTFWEATRYFVAGVRAGEDGEHIHIRLRAKEESGKMTRLFSLRVEEYAALPRRPAVGAWLSCEAARAIADAADASAAYGRGLSILGYGANSARRLEQKLTSKGYDKEVAARAVRALSDRGYLQEARDACRMARQILRRGRGMRRILQELRAKGYGDAALEAVREELAAEDFVALCAQVAQKKCRTMPADREQREKLAAYLLRCGFDAAQIRAAMQNAWR
jgi:regulatory protein